MRKQEAIGTVFRRSREDIRAIMARLVRDVFGGRGR